MENIKIPEHKMDHAVLTTIDSNVIDNMMDQLKEKMEREIILDKKSVTFIIQDYKKKMNNRVAEFPFLNIKKKRKWLKITFDSNKNIIRVTFDNIVERIKIRKERIVIIAVKDEEYFLDLEYCMSNSIYEALVKYCS